MNVAHYLRQRIDWAKLFVLYGSLTVSASLVIYCSWKVASSL